MRNAYQTKKLRGLIQGQWKKVLCRNYTHDLCICTIYWVILNNKDDFHVAYCSIFDLEKVYKLLLRIKIDFFDIIFCLCLVTVVRTDIHNDCGNQNFLYTKITEKWKSLVIKKPYRHFRSYFVVWADIYTNENLCRVDTPSHSN